MIVRLLLAMLATLALTTAPAAARPCLSLSQVQAKHPGQHPRYRSVEGRQCWYVGKTPAKSDFSLPTTASSRGGGESRPTPVSNRTRAPASQGDDGSYAEITGTAGVAPGPRATNHAGEPSRPPIKAIRTAYSATLDHDEILSMCGGPCPDFRGMDLYGMQARLEAAHAAFMFLQAMR